MRLKFFYWNCLIILFPVFLYAGHSISFDPSTGVMEITLTDGEDISITKHPQTGGLAINGECSGVLASGIRRLRIFGDDGENEIDLRGMSHQDFPGLGGPAENGGRRTQVYAAGGDDTVYGNDMGNEILGGDGNDMIVGGRSEDYIHGDSGDDRIDGGDGNDSVIGDAGNDLIYSGLGTDKVYGGFGNDTIFGDTNDSLSGGNLLPKEDEYQGDDVINIVKPYDEIPGLTRLHSSQQNKIFKLEGVGNLTITDFTGIDTLSFKEFDKPIIIDFSLLETPQIFTPDSDTLTIDGVFETVVGTKFNDSFRLQPNTYNPITIDGFEGNDTLIVDCMGLDVIDDGQTISVSGFQPITYSNNTKCVVNNTSSIQNKITLVNDITLYQNYPNPFNPSTEISLQIPYAGHVLLTIYNTRGQQIAKLVDEQFKTGFHHYLWNAQNTSSGIYYYTLYFNNKLVKTNKMILLR